MLANMSFKIKLLTLFVSAIAGFVILTLVALKGLNMLNDANVTLKALSRMQLSAEQEYVEMIRFSDQLQMLNEQTASAYIDKVQTKLDHLENQNSFIDTQLVNSDMSQAITQGKTQNIAFYRAIQTYVVTKRLLGFDATSGLTGKVSDISQQIHEQIKSVSFVLAKYDVMHQLANRYQQDSSEENLAAFNKAYDDYYARLKGFGLLKKFGALAPVYLQAVTDFGISNVLLSEHSSNLSQIKLALDMQRDKVATLLSLQVSKAEKQSLTESQMAKSSLIIASLIIALFATMILFVIVKSVKSNLHNLSADLIKVQAGDLTARARVNEKRNDEFDALATSLNGMTQGLGTVISNVVDTSNDVNLMVNELDQAVLHISESNGSISSQTSTLATSTEEISQSVSSVFNATQDMKEQVQQTYDSAQQGSKTIKDVLNNLSSTVLIVGETSAQLDELGRLSGDIDGVIGMINELAGQTNLLALNAAIEAARAGDAGRGFSVVADEVRSLASKTVEATTQISTIVGNIQVATQAAIEKMASSKDNLDAIESFSEQAELAMHDIESSAQKGSDASIEMAASIEQVAQTTTAMSQDMEQIANRLKNDTGAIDRIESNAKTIGGKVNYLAQQAQVFTV